MHHLGHHCIQPALKVLLPLLFHTLLCSTLYAQYAPGQNYFGTNNYIEYRAGNAPVIICVPHGGALQPAGIPDRNCPECVTVRDANTIELAKALQQSIQQTWGCEPHIVICHLHRRKLDANREIVEAAQGNPAAELAWNEYQNFIQSAKNTILDQQERGLLIDLHGHGHDIQRLELGYLLSGSQLRLSDAVLTAPGYTEQASIRNLVSTNPNGYNLPELLRGEYALGTLLAQGGYPSVPGDDDPAPDLGEDYFSGGYTTDVFGSVEEGALDAIQIECNFTGVRDNAANRQQFAEVLAGALETYLLQHYFQPDIPCAAVLAVSDISDFYAQCDENRIELIWKTTVESDVTAYAVESSRDGVIWMFSGSVVSKNDLQGGRYRFVTEDVSSRYFRLKTVGYDGSYRYSPVIKSNCESLPAFRIFPNPASSVVYWEGNHTGDFNVRLYSGTGLLVREIRPEEPNGPINLEGLPDGMYRIEIVGTPGILGNGRVVKIH